MSCATAHVVVIGAGPYGLSTAAHLRARGLSVRIFGSPLASWSEHMPTGMLLKSPPSASSLSAPHPGFALDAYCRAAGEQVLGEHDQVPVELFVRYGRWFMDQLVPEVEDARVRTVDRKPDGAFRLKLSSGEELAASAVVVASGLTGFAHVPEALAAAVPDGPSALGPVSHTSHHTDLTGFAGRRVLVVGAGQSAQENAALLHEAGAEVRMLVRGSDGLKFGAAPTAGPRWHPDTPVGRSWALYGFVHYAAAFRHLPVSARLRLVKRVLGPCGAWWLRPRVEHRFPVLAGQRITETVVDGDGVEVSTTGRDGTPHRIEADHVMAGTGYRVHLEALDFLSPELRAALRRTGGFPGLDARLSSSVPGLYFTGLPAAGSFGPVLRFVCGTRFASPRLAAAVTAHCSSAA
ncbi:NAD(P)-binding domain-containing protein [Streptomyces europaeiscabiei]|uniref:NAD(P)-binding domain-containing protein n=1 Tax=Streptomyces europaeiscabiei TaxID=146819 RepID=UPI0029A85A39|nr:NAD(P)-binding domain-containing protein [Streptomyces europaeiscabiei]MDX3695662.1 NAD(P)-binding domain-containing protein [Streptomyces europaeiscabiei]